MMGVHPNKDSETNGVVAGFQAELADWQWDGGRINLSEMARTVNEWAQELWPTFLPATWQKELVEMPNVLFTFDPEHPNILGHYRPGRNGAGLRWEINLNPVHLTIRSAAQSAPTILHELVHLFEDLTESSPGSALRNNYHSAWFRKTVEQAGIPCTRYGRDLGIIEDSPFAEWVKEKGLSFESEESILDLLVRKIKEGEIESEAVEAGGKKRLPKRLAWVCHCPKAPTIYVARGYELQARCEACGCRFQRKTETS